MKSFLIKLIDKHRNLIPILYLSWLCFETIFASFSTLGILSIKFYLGFVILLLNFIIYFSFRRLYKYALIVAIVLGLFNLIRFTIAEYTACSSLNGFKVCYQPQAFLVGLFVYFLNFKRVNRIVLDSLRVRRTHDQQLNFEKDEFTKNVLEFKKQYSTHSEEKLIKIVDEARHVPEAIEAAKQLINERRLAREE